MGADHNGECTCDELIIRGERVPPPRFHDCEYVRLRTALISEAEKIADSIVDVVSPSEDGGASHANWTIIFAVAMDRLAEPLLNGHRNKSG